MSCRRIEGQLYAFTPHFLEAETNYLSADPETMTAMLEDEIRFLRNNWTLDGRPTMVLVLTERHFQSSRCVSPCGSRGAAPVVVCSNLAGHSIKKCES